MVLSGVFEDQGNFPCLDTQFLDKDQGDFLREINLFIMISVTFFLELGLFTIWELFYQRAIQIFHDIGGDFEDMGHFLIFDYIF